LGGLRRRGIVLVAPLGVLHDVGQLLIARRSAAADLSTS